VKCRLGGARQMKTDTDGDPWRWINDQSIPRHPLARPSAANFHVWVLVPSGLAALRGSFTAASAPASLTFSRFNHQTWRSPRSSARLGWDPLVVMMACSVFCLAACRTCAFIGI